MTSLEELKQELINQKNEIEAKGGTVIVANTYPSPAEITAGIKTITASTNSGDTTVTITSANTQNSASNTISSVDSTLNTLSNVVPNTETLIEENEVDSTIKEINTNSVSDIDNSIELTNSNQVDETDLSATSEIVNNEEINENIIPESGTTATIEPNNETIYSSNIVN